MKRQPATSVYDHDDYHHLYDLKNRRKRFIFQLTEYRCNNTSDIFFLDIPRIFLEQNLMYHRHFLRVNGTFYGAVNVIHDVITKANPFP